MGEAARILAPGGKYMLFSVFGNDGFGHKDMQEMLAHPGFGGEVEVRFVLLPSLSLQSATSYVFSLLTRKHHYWDLFRRRFADDIGISIVVLYPSA